MARAKRKDEFSAFIGTAICLALGTALTFFFRRAGLDFYEYLPLHYAALIAGLAFGPFAGSMTGLIAPFPTALLFGLPLFDASIGIMAFELASYGLVSGLCYRRGRWHLHTSLLLSMLTGRIVYGALNWLFLGFEDKTYTVNAFLYTAFRRPVTGIALILAFVPLTVLLLERTPLASRNA
jgi:hypothetical protein